MKAVPFPEDVISRFEVAPAPATLTMTDETLDRAALAAQQGERLLALLRAVHGRNAVLHAEARRGRRATRRACACPQDLEAAAVHDQGRAGRRSGGHRAVGHQPHRAARRLHALLPDVVHDGPAAAVAGHQRQLAVDARLLEGGVPAAHIGPGDRVFFPFSFGPFLGFWAGLRGGLADGPALRARRRHVHAGAAGDDRRHPADGRVLHADLRAAPGRGGRRRTWPAGALAVELRAGADRVGRTGRQHPGDARAHRVGLGRASARPPRPDRSGAHQLRVLGVAGRAAPERGRVHLRGPGLGHGHPGRRTGRRANWW